MIDPRYPATPQMVAFLCVLLLGLLVIPFVARRLRVPNSIRVLAWTSLVIHMLVGVVLLSSLGLGGSDAGEYHSLATQLSTSVTGDDAPPSLIEGKEGWVWLLAALYVMTGPAPLVGVAINGLMMAIALLVGYATVALVTSDVRASRAAALLYLASPGQLFWGSLPLREASVVLLCALSVFFVLRSLKGSVASWLGVAFVLGLLTLVRGPAAVLVAGALAAAVCIAALKARTSAGRRIMAFVAAASCIALAVYLFDRFEQETTADRIDAIRSSQSVEAASGFDVGDDDVQSEMTLTTVRALPRTIVGPYPWEIGAVVSFLPFVSYWWFIVGLAYAGVRARRAAAPTAVFLLPAMGIAVALAAYSGNYGTMIRLRDQALPFLIPIAAIGWARMRVPRDITRSSESPHV